MIRAAATACAAVLALTSCSSDSEEASSEAGPSETAAEPISALEGLTGDDLCAALPAATVEQELGVAVEGSASEERGRAPAMQAPYFLSRHCDYDTDGLPGFTTELATAWDEETSDTEVLDSAFSDPTSEPAKVGDYQELPDLGVVAGFGADAMLSRADVAGQVLAVVLRVGEERLVMTMSTTGRASLEQLRPLADELVANVEAATT